jgi:signal transduction histidine kinase
LAVRTPLNSIINYLEVALEEVLDERARQHLQRSLQASKSLVFQVNDLLNLTEAEDSDFNTHEDNVDLRNMAMEVIGSFKEGPIGEKLDISLEDDGNVPRVVRGDPSMLRQVMSNLLANSIQHSVGGVTSVKCKVFLFSSPASPQIVLKEIPAQYARQSMPEIVSQFTK